MKAGRISHEAQNFTQRGFHAEAQSSLRLTRGGKENTDISLRVFASGLRAGLAALREILFRSQLISRGGAKKIQTSLCGSLRPAFGPAWRLCVKYFFAVSRFHEKAYNLSLPYMKLIRPLIIP